MKTRLDQYCYMEYNNGLSKKATTGTIRTNKVIEVRAYNLIRHCSVFQKVSAFGYPAALIINADFELASLNS